MRKTGDKYDEWIKTLPEKSQELYQDIILPTNWYDFIDAYINPVKTSGKLFFNGDFSKAAYEISKASSMKTLKGVYSIFVRVASLQYVIKRVSRIISTIYSKEAKIEAVLLNPNMIKITLLGFKKGEELIYDGLGGWVDGLLTTIGKKIIDINYKIEEDTDELLIGNAYIKFE